MSRQSSRKRSSPSLKTVAGVGIGGIVVAFFLLLAALVGLEIDSDRLRELAGQGDPAGAVNAQDAIRRRPDDGSIPDWYEIYFTDPRCPAEEQRVGGVDEIIAADIGRARRSVDMAAYDFDSGPMTEALIAAGQRGLTVRLVTDSDNGDNPAIRRLRRSGLSVVEDGRSGLMHNKFVVLDGRSVWTGSLNFTSNGSYCNNNNAVRFDLPDLAANYMAEMDEMVNGRQFGPTSPRATPFETVTVGDARLENYFAPEQRIAPIIAERIASAQRELLFMAFSFTEPSITAAMAGRVEAGVALRGVFETVGSDTSFSAYGPLAQLAAGRDRAEIRRDGNFRLMHHKVIVVDREMVILGSFNFTDSANTQNDENVVIVHDPLFASFFVEEFETVWGEAEGR